MTDRGQRPQAWIEADEESGDVRITLRGRDLQGPLPRVTVDAFSGTAAEDGGELTADQWEHLERACEAVSGTGAEASRFAAPGVRGRALEVRESAALALAHLGLVRFWRVRVGADSAAWAITPTAAGREAVQRRSGDAPVVPDGGRLAS